jgi:hypothetical protein
LPRQARDKFEESCKLTAFSSTGYDHWGFSCMGMDHDKQYLRYLGARVGAYRNVPTPSNMGV